MDEEVPAIDVALVRALLAQGPDGAAGASIRPVTSAGTDNALFRVGEGLVARLPRVRWARAQPAGEHRWLGHLAQGLPLAIPEPVFLGQPAAGYPFEWALHRWRDGTNALGADLSADLEAAERLGEFVAALRTPDPTNQDATRALARSRYNVQHMYTMTGVAVKPSTRRRRSLV